MRAVVRSVLAVITIAVSMFAGPVGNSVAAVNRANLFDIVSVRPSSQQNQAILHAVEEVKGRGVPEWLSLNAEMGGTIMSMPTREQINLPVQEQLIVELYSK